VAVILKSVFLLMIVHFFLDEKTNQKNQGYIKNTKNQPIFLK